MYDFFRPIDKKIWSRTKNWVDYRRDLIIFRVLLISLCSLVVSASFYLSQGLMNSFYMCCVQFLIISTCTLLLIFGKDLWAKNAALFFVNITFFISASMLGRGVPFYIYFLPIITATLFFYSTSQVKHTVLMLFLAFLSLVVLETSDYSLFKTADVITPHQSRHRTIIMLLISILLAAVMVRELIMMNIYNQRKLRRLNHKLKKRNERLTKINAELDSFVYRSSHDLRSPLTSIMGIINIIKSENDISKIKEYMSFQERSVKKLDGLVQDILDISRNSRLDIEAQPISLNAFIHQCVEGLSYMEEYKKVSVDIDIPFSLACYSDPKRLKVVFNNILSNGFRYHDFSKAGCLIKVSLHSIDQDGISILFEDNGMGIKEEHQHRIFDMFYRGTDRNNGSGLGLYIVKEAITKIGGRVNLSSTYGQGTSLLVTFPDLYPKEDLSTLAHGTLFVN